ncbi:uncharacterized protein LOC135398286 [Ornithodoros turicata]|uniref:uncharacterized protein LOC135398286 n=1 Tax=Ornithodoros turicata TaxID=34597 RepID=UPI00313A343B
MYALDEPHDGVPALPEDSAATMSQYPQGAGSNTLSCTSPTFPFPVPSPPPYSSSPSFSPYGYMSPPMSPGAAYFQDPNVQYCQEYPRRNHDTPDPANNNNNSSNSSSSSASESERRKSESSSSSPLSGGSPSKATGRRRPLSPSHPPVGPWVAPIRPVASPVPSKTVGCGFVTMSVMLVIGGVLGGVMFGSYMMQFFPLREPPDTHGFSGDLLLQTDDHEGDFSHRFGVVSVSTDAPPSVTTLNEPTQSIAINDTNGIASNS